MYNEKDCEQYDVLASTMFGTVRYWHDKLSYWAYLSYWNIVLDRASTMSSAMICGRYGTILVRCRRVLPFFSTILARCSSYRDHRRYAPGTIILSYWGSVLRTGRGAVRYWYGTILVRYDIGTIILTKLCIPQFEIAGAESSTQGR